MSIKKITNIFIFLFSTCSFSQNDSINDIYVKFDKNYSCSRGSKDVDNTEFKSYYFSGSFYICWMKFKIKENTVILKVPKNKIDSFMTPREIKIKCIEKGMKYAFNPNHLFPKIYIVEDYSPGDFYLLFEVEAWNYEP